MLGAPKIGGGRAPRVLWSRRLFPGALPVYCKVYIVRRFLKVFFYNSSQRIVRNKPNLDYSQHRHKRSDAGNFGSVCLLVLEKIHSQTNRHGDNINVVFPMIKTLTYHLL